MGGGAPMPGQSPASGGANAMAAGGNPMQEMMQLSQQLMSGGLATPQVGGTAPPAVPPAMSPAATAMANPMANLMQMMGGGQQQPFGGGLGGGAGFGAGPGVGGAAPTPQDNPMALQMQRVRFAGQLQQLLAMGFTDEAVCLRVLAQHDGRVDSAIDALLSMGS